MALGCLGLRILLFGCLLSLGATVKINDAARYEDLAAGSEARARRDESDLGGDAAPPQRAEIDIRLRSSRPRRSSERRRGGVAALASAP